jgi:hypothetical protein
VVGVDVAEEVSVQWRRNAGAAVYEEPVVGARYRIDGIDVGDEE